MMAPTSTAPDLDSTRRPERFLRPTENVATLPVEVPALVPAPKRIPPSRSRYGGDRFFKRLRPKRHGPVVTRRKPLRPLKSERIPGPGDQSELGCRMPGRARCHGGAEPYCRGGVRLLPGAVRLAQGWIPLCKTSTPCPRRSTSMPRKTGFGRAGGLAGGRPQNCSPPRVGQIGRGGARVTLAR